jgi:hypothetical protein
MSHHLKTLPKCEAKTRSNTSCQQVAVANGRCYPHGGKSTGPRTPEGLLRMKESKIKHGRYSKERIEERKAFRIQLQQTKKRLEGILQAI